MSEQQPSPPPWKVARAYGTDGRWHGAYVVTEDRGAESLILATVWGDDGVVDDPRPALANAILMAQASRVAAALREILGLARAAPEAGNVSGAAAWPCRVEAIALEALEGILGPVDRSERAPVDVDSSDLAADPDDGAGDYEWEGK